MHQSHLIHRFLTSKKYVPLQNAAIAKQKTKKCCRLQCCNDVKEWIYETLKNKIGVVRQCFKFGIR